MKRKKNIIKVILPIIIVLIFQTSFCQKNYIPGYIIRLNGDTVKGYIDYRTGEKTPRKIFFKKNLTDDKTVYTPIEIKEFRVPNDIYKSAIVLTEISPIISSTINPFNIPNTDMIQFDPKIMIETDTVFLETLIEAKKSLYYYSNKLGKEQFYINQDSSFELLVCKQYLVAKEIVNTDIKYKNNNVIMEIDKYMDQLSLYFKDNPEIQPEIQKTKYTKSSMEKLFHSYYKSMPSNLEFQKKTEKTLTEIGVLAGESISTIKFKSIINIDYLSNADFSQSINFSAGLFCNIIIPRSQKIIAKSQNKWSMYNDLIYTSYKMNGLYNDYVNADCYYITKTKIGYSYLIMNNMLRYCYPIGNFSFFFNVGISNGVGFAETNYKNVESMVYSIHGITEGKALEYTRKYEPGFVLGWGIKFKKFSFDMRLERGSGICGSIQNLSSVTNRYFFLLGYRIK